MLNMSQNTRHTSRTLKIAGIAPINELTTTRMPSNRDKARSGRRALNVLITLIAGISPKPTKGAIMPIIEVLGEA